MVANQSSPISSGLNPNPTPKVRAKFGFALNGHLFKSGGSLWGLGGGFAEAEAGFDATPSFDSDDEQSAVLRCLGKSEEYEPYHAFGRH